MSGGIIEGLKKCFTEKDAMSKHIFLLILTFIISLPTAIATINTSGKESDIYKYLYVQHSYLGLITFVGTIVLGLFILHFMHNAIKYFTWEDSQKDEEKVKALTILPDLGKGLFSHFWKWVGFWVIWIFSISVTLIILTILAFMPFVKYLAFVAIAAYIIALMVSLPFIIVSFSKNYQIKGNISPLLIFKYFPRLIGPAALLGLKYLGLGIVYAIAVILLVIIIFTLLAIIAKMFNTPENISENTYVMALLTTVITYFSTILGLAYYYAAAKIYYDKIDKKAE